ncbi:MAG: Asp-tRNA(Asn)/Glu-tRNA(Gln) amidotransferase subunit GatC [Gammaproteobacteria bacterium]|nr:Asp-tRNA(Asn)/Glu-tRNA(Gln) amidotransferase GatCAB subunit C [Gammaproteobacteria bacterium]
MSLAEQDIDKLCELARLEIDADEIGDVAKKLSDIVDMVSQLSAVPTDGVEPMAHPLDRPQRLRDDVVTETNLRELYQRNAPAVERGLYLVPKVIE